MKYENRPGPKSRAALAACASLLLVTAALAQGDLSGGVGQFAVQPKKERVVVSAKRPSVAHLFLDLDGRCVIFHGPTDKPVVATFAP